MELFIYGILAGLVVAYLFVQVVVWLTLREIRQRVDLEAMLKKIEEKVDETVIQVRIEEHQGEFFVYNVKDNQFVAQGVDAETLRAAVASRSDGRTVLITEGDEDVIERFRGTIIKTDSA